MRRDYLDDVTLAALREKIENDIIRRMKAVGTYKDEYIPTVDRLAMLYIHREEIEKQFRESGGSAVIEYTNKAGATNPAKNPYLAARDEVYSQLLAHERELGLTPVGLKKINDAAVKTVPRSSFADAIAQAMNGAGG